MKNKLYWLCGLGMILAACQSDELVEAVVTDADEANFTITLTAPEAMSTTRTAQGTNSALGGLSNVDMDEYDLRYQLAVYRCEYNETDETWDATLVISPQIQVVDEYQTVAYSLRLTPNRYYKFVAWADFVKTGTEEDLHYDTSTIDDDGDWVITCIDDEDEQLNDESRDAFFITSSIKSVTTDYNTMLELKRPFAKVRIIATDWEYEDLEMPDNIRITYYGCKRFTNIHLLTGVSDSETLASLDSDSDEDDGSSETTEDDTVETTTYTVSIDKDTKNYTYGYDGSDYEVEEETGATYSYRTLTVDYLMTDLSDASNIHFEFEAYDDETLVNSYDFFTDIPIQRNYLTTIIGNVLTTAAGVGVWVNEDFDDEYVIPSEEVATYEELTLALALGVDEITFTDDIDTEGASLKVFETTSTINLNGYTLTAGTIYYYPNDTYEGGSTLTINGETNSDTRSDDDSKSDTRGKIVSSGYGINLRYSGAGLELNDVIVEGTYSAILMGRGFSTTDYKSEELEDGQILTISNSDLSKTTTSGYGTIHILAHNSEIKICDSEITNSVSLSSGITNANKYCKPEGCTVTLTDTDITTAGGYCVRLYADEGCEESNLTINGGTFKSTYYNTIDVAGTNIAVEDATIINTGVFNSGGIQNAGGSGIALWPAPVYNESTGANDMEVTPRDEHPFTTDVSLSNIKYLLASNGTSSFYVQIWDGDFVSYEVSDTSGRTYYGSDGHTDDSQYSYTETTEE